MLSMADAPVPTYCLPSRDEEAESIGRMARHANNAFVARARRGPRTRMPAPFPMLEAQRMLRRLSREMPRRRRRRHADEDEDAVP